MPWAPPKRCSKIGCGVLVKSGVRFCDEHRKEYFRALDKTRVRERFYDTAEWKEARNLKRRTTPYCELCRAQGIMVRMVIVDHIVPISTGGARFDQSNMQSLCSVCHQRKRGKERHE